MYLRNVIFVLAASAVAAPVLAQDAPAGDSAQAAPLVAPAWIAGVNPSQRPANAPVITEYTKTAGWYDEALTGVSQPYPSSLRWLEDQGGWFNPFLHAGMTGPYDIRGWHSAD